MFFGNNKLLFFKHFLWICSFVCLQASGQQNNRFTLYTVNDGLSQSTVNDIAQDKYGFLWIGTDNGLCRFDGYNFKTYKTNTTDPKAINSDRGFHFYLDKSQRLWIASFNGLSIYNAETDNFTNVVTYAPDAVKSTNQIFGEDGRYLWAGLNHYGVVRVDKTALKAEVVPVPGCGNSTDHTSWFSGFWDNGKLWIVSQWNFVIYDTATKNTTKVHIPLLNLVDCGNGIAVGANLHHTLLIDKKNLSYKIAAVDAGDQFPEFSNLYKSSGQQVIVCGAKHGIAYLNPINGNVAGDIAAIGESNGRKPLSASCAFRDRSGNLWVGTPSDGLLKLNFPFRNFKLYRAPDSKLNAIYSIYASKDTIFASCGNSGINIYSKTDGFKKNITVNANLPFITNRVFLGPSASPDRLMLIADAKTNSAHNIPLFYSKTAARITLAPNNIENFYKNHWGQGNFRHFIVKDGNALLTNVGQYLVQLRENTDGGMVADTLKLFGQDPICCFRAQNGGLWVGTFKGVYLFENGAWQLVKLEGNPEVKTINQDSDGNMWLGTPLGIFILNHQQKLIKHWDEINGLVNQHLYGILCDDDGNMWFSHNKGLTEYERSTKKFRHFGIEDGLQSLEFNAGAYFKAGDGELFFGGINGITAFYPRQITDNSNAPAVVITGIGISDKPLQTAAAPWSIKKLTLAYWQNSVSFDFTLPELSNPSQNQYAYTMERLDNGWINSGSRRFARYTSLDPGHYLFKVRAANNNGTWGKPTQIDVDVIPPFWRRWWFVVTEFLIAATAIALAAMLAQRLIDRRKIRAMEIQQKIQSERERISRDLHDNIGTQLSLINKNIKTVAGSLGTVPDDEIGLRLSKAQQDSAEVIGVLRETIWALNKSEISLEEFADKLKDFIQKNVGVCPALLLEFDENDNNSMLILSPVEALHLFRICQEAVTNAIKYAQASVLKVSVQHTTGKYHITISDNGLGFDPKLVDKNRHFGIDNMHFRAGEIECRLLFHSIVNQGTTVTLEKK